MVRYRYPPARRLSRVSGTMKYQRLHMIAQMSPRLMSSPPARCRVTGRPGCGPAWAS